MPEEKSDNSEPISIGRIPLKQVRVKRTEPSGANPMNKLVPYLDLFCRLDDEELARLAGVDEEVCGTLRKQVVAIDRGLARYVDLLPRLSDGELVRLTGATAKTIRFWRLCQPKSHNAEPSAADVGDGVVAKAATQKATTAPQPVGTRQTATAEPSPSETMTRGIVPDAAHGRTAAEDSGIRPPPAQPGVPTPVASKRLMQFSGEPFPGFEAPEGVEADEIAIDDIGDDDLVDDPLRTL